MHCKEMKQKNQVVIKVRDPALKITEIYFQEKLLCTFLTKMEITDVLGLILEMSIHKFVEIFLE